MGGDVAIPYGGANTEFVENMVWLQENVAFTAIESPGNLEGIATPVCALARNDVRFIWYVANL